MQIIKKSCPRTAEDRRQLSQTVAEVIDSIREGGDAALREYNIKFEKNDRELFRLGRSEIEAAYKEVSPREIEDMRTAAENIRSFAEAQKETLTELSGFKNRQGAALGHSVIPAESCCCYVPGGGYPLYSTALMLIVPAKAAGVKRVAACSPSVKGSRSINSKTVVAMDIAGADEIYAVGGAQAIAAFSYGTEQIKPVSLIVGPGNQYVAEAKRQCFGQVGIDFVAGPSEVLIIADDSADPEIIAADILAQSEHDAMAKGMLITTSRQIAERTVAAVTEQLKSLPTAGTAKKSWETFGEVLLADDLEEAAAAANDCAPEHLEVIVKEPDALIGKLHNYGALFIGKYSAEVFGDYVSGPNHTLPTSGAARYTGGVWAGTFLKVCTWQRMDAAAMDALIGTTAEMARGEGLEAHARAAEARKKLA